MPTIPFSTRGTDPNGYAVFGVVRGTGMTVVNENASVPPVDEGGNFASIPLTGVQPNDPNFPGDTTAANYEILTGVTVLRGPVAGFSDSETFAVASNTNPGLVTPTITNGKLTLAYTAGQTGVATITLSSTDSDGASVQTSFTVTVGTHRGSRSSPSLPRRPASVKTSPTITGTATDNVAVTSLTASVDGGALHAVTVNPDGTFTFNPSLAVDGTADGPHTVVFTAMDAAGNTSTPASITFSLETTPPVVNITSPASGQSFTTSPSIVGTATDNVSLAGLSASVDGGGAGGDRGRPGQLHVYAVRNGRWAPQRRIHGDRRGREYIHAGDRDVHHQRRVPSRHADRPD